MTGKCDDCGKIRELEVDDGLSLCSECIAEIRQCQRVMRERESVSLVGIVKDWARWVTR
jgi:hypothetical protein